MRNKPTAWNFMVFILLLLWTLSGHAQGPEQGGAQTKLPDAPSASKPEAQTYILMVFSSPVAGKKSEYNQWYNQQHMLDVVSVPGFVSAQRFVISEVQLRPITPQKANYMVMYKIVTPDLASVFAEVARRSKAGMTKMSPALDVTSLSSYTYKALGPVQPHTPVAEKKENSLDFYQLAFGEAVAGKEAEFNQWYDEHHLPDCVAVPGYVSGERFIFSDIQLGTDKGATYLAAFHVVAPDVAPVFEEFKKMAPKMTASPAFDGARTNGYTYKAIGPVIDGDQVRAERARKEASSYAPGSSFRDCPDCPEMVVIPAGQFMMGSADSDAEHQPEEGPIHQVTIAYNLAVGKYEVTREEYARFVSATQRPMPPKCFVPTDPANAKYSWVEGRNWTNPGYAQTPRDAVVCTSWKDGNDYAAWLSGVTGKKYRLLSEAEWEYAARGSSSASRFWGSSTEESCKYANVADTTFVQTWTSTKPTVACNDGYVFTSPVGTFKPNPYGLYDMFGNAWEWVEDCQNKDYQGAPADGSAWMSGNCADHARRGGSWFRPALTAAGRGFLDDSGWHSNAGFRIARELP